MTFENQVYQTLDTMQPGEKIILDPAHENYTRFVEIAKEYIDMHEYGNGIGFSTDYKMIKKQYWPVTKKLRISYAQNTQ